MIDLIVYDKTMTAIGIVDTQTTLFWERRFYEAGYFEMNVPANENNNALFSAGRYLMRADALESGMILRVAKNVDAEGVTTITVIGRFLSYLLHGHIVRSAQMFTGNAETIMRQLVSATVLNNESPDYIAGLSLGDMCGSDKTVSVYLIYNDLHDALREISRLSGVAFRVVLNPNTGAMTFECYEGHDYRANQYVNAQVVFSPEYDTIIGAAEYAEDDSVTVNAVTMVYSGEFGTVADRYAPGEASGTELHEISVITDQCVTTTTTGGEIVIDINATKSLLRGMAPQYISPKDVNVSASVAHTGGMVYKQDYDIGDIVTVEYRPFGISLTRRIHKIAESYSDAGTEIIPDFGEISPKEDV